MIKSRRKAVWGWAMYDWANSAFATTVMSGFFPVFFKQYWSAGVDVNLSTARLGLGNAAAGLLVALAAPILGAVADRGSARKRFLALFAYLGVLMTAALYFVGQGQWAFALVVYAMGVIGFSGANIFYDALMPEVTGEKDVDFVSGFGFSMGYLGGGLLFLINVLMVTMPQRFGLADAGQAVRIGFLTRGPVVGLFYLVHPVLGARSANGPNADHHRHLVWRFCSDQAHIQPNAAHEDRLALLVCLLAVHRRCRHDYPHGGGLRHEPGLCRQ